MEFCIFIYMYIYTIYQWMRANQSPDKIIPFLHDCPFHFKYSIIKLTLMLNLSNVNSSQQLKQLLTKIHTCTSSCNHKIFHSKEFKRSFGVKEFHLKMLKLKVIIYTISEWHKKLFKPFIQGFNVAFLRKHISATLTIFISNSHSTHLSVKFTLQSMSVLYRHQSINFKLQSVKLYTSVCRQTV